jgi:hypothetical protein
VETSVAALRTDAAKELARTINAADPHDWWSAFAASYHELRASAQGRSREKMPPKMPAKLPGSRLETGQLQTGR